MVSDNGEQMREAVRKHCIDQCFSPTSIPLSSSLLFVLCYVTKSSPCPNYYIA